MTASGSVEYVRQGEGPAVLVFHDAAGGYDQGVALAGFLAEEGFEIIVPSRPGYLRTPLSAGGTPQKQAAASAQLLDNLSIGRVSILAFGAGAPVALEFARMFPQRVDALVLAGAAVSRYDSSAEFFIPFLHIPFVGRNIESWLFARQIENNSARALQSTLSISSSGDEALRNAWSNGILKNPDQLVLFNSLALATTPADPREVGLQNDLHQLRDLPEFPFQAIAAPVLLVHGALDKVFPPAPVETSRALFPNAELLTLPDAGHLVLLGTSGTAAEEHITAFLKNILLPMANKSQLTKLPSGLRIATCEMPHAETAAMGIWASVGDVMNPRSSMASRTSSSICSSRAPCAARLAGSWRKWKALAGI
jgi:pimeloyl-ACP methyl ester carboxylesterase